MGRGQSNWCQNSCCLKISAIVSEIYFIKASEGGTIIFQSSNRLENSAGYREWSSILSDRKLSPILYGGIFQNYHDWTQTANSNANIICNMLFLNHPLSTGLRTQLGKQAWKAEQHIVNRPTNASFWNIHFKVFFVLVFFQDFRLCVAVRCSNKWDSNEAGLSSRTSLQTTCHLNPFPINKNTSSITPLVISNINTTIPVYNLQQQILFIWIWDTLKTAQAYHFISTADALVITV